MKDYYNGEHPWEHAVQKQKQQRRTTAEGKNDFHKFLSTQPLRIHTDSKWIEEFLAEKNDETDNTNDNTTDVIEYLLNEVLPSVASFWHDTLKVYPIQEKIHVDDLSCTLTNEDDMVFGIEDVDLIIYATINPSTSCTTNNVEEEVAYGSNCQYDQYSRPIVGSINFCLEYMDIKTIMGRASIMQSTIHQYSRILGGTIDSLIHYRDRDGNRWTSFPLLKESVSCVGDYDDNNVNANSREEEVILPSNSTLREGHTNRGIRYFEIVTPTVATVVRNHFNCNDMFGALLEHQASVMDNLESCFGSLWESRLFSSYLDILSLNELYVSTLTLALLEDSGWYTANYTKSKVSSFGRFAGCDFVFKDCIINGGEIPTYSQSSFCNTTTTFTSDDTSSAMIEGSAHCGKNSHEISFCNLIDYSNLTIELSISSPPMEYQYFTNQYLGAYPPKTDYCPTYSKPYIDCTLPPDNNSVDTLYIESFGTNSKCVTTATESVNNGTIKRPICLQTDCVKVNNQWKVSLQNLNIIPIQINCEYENQVIDILNVSVICPSLVYICPDVICPSDCSGRGICNLNSQACICNDIHDPSPICANSPPFLYNEKLMETSSSAPTGIVLSGSSIYPTSISQQSLNVDTLRPTIFLEYPTQPTSIQDEYETNLKIALVVVSTPMLIIAGCFVWQWYHHRRFVKNFRDFETQAFSSNIDDREIS